MKGKEMSNVVDLGQVKALLGAQYMVANAYILVEQFEQDPNLLESIPPEQKDELSKMLEGARITVALNVRPSKWIMEKVLAVIKSEVQDTEP